MNVLGLISGGKDSIYNLYLCKKAGFNIVALGNLYPPKNGFFIVFLKCF
jgi:diphthine-ammonia ligase